MCSGPELLTPTDYGLTFFFSRAGNDIENKITAFECTPGRQSRANVFFWRARAEFSASAVGPQDVTILPRVVGDLISKRSVKPHRKMPRFDSYLPEVPLLSRCGRSCKQLRRLLRLLTRSGSAELRELLVPTKSRLWRRPLPRQACV